MKFLFLFIFLSNGLFAQRSIDTNEIVSIGGIQQYVQIKSKDDSNPILLFLHGGPGSSVLNKAEKMTGKLQQHFIVVHWDQRETGKTLALNKSTQPLTLSLFYDDTNGIVETLLKKFNRQKLYLAGYSWGSALGFYMADKHPELLYAYIAISPVIHQWKSDSISLGMLKETMGRKAREELSTVKVPFENAGQLYYHRKWLLKHEGQKFVSLGFRKTIVESWAATWFDVWKQSCDVNLFQTLPAINCPVYFFAGSKDYNTNSSITQAYYNQVKAPKKNLYLFKDAGHGLPETEPDAFQEIIIQRILPETIK